VAEEDTDAVMERSDDYAWHDKGGGEAPEVSETEYDTSDTEDEDDDQKHRSKSVRR
jgi:hypothetical protein